MSEMINAGPTSTAGRPAPVEPKKSSGSRWLVLSLGLVAALVVGLFGGILIGQNTATASPAASTRQGGGFGGGPGAGNGGGAAGGFGRGGFTAGTIVSINGNVIVVKNQQGTDVNVTATSTTTVTNTIPGALTDLKPGDTVTATGQPDSSGNVTALTIAKGQLRTPGGGAGATPTPAPSN